MPHAVPAFHTKAVEQAQQRSEDAVFESERASRFLSRIDKLLAELSDVELDEAEIG